MAKAVAVIDK